MSPRWRIPGRVVRRAINRNVRRAIRRSFVRRRARRWLIGGAVLLAIAGTHRAVKLREEDARRLENHYGRPVEELTEDEINQGMHYHNIQPLTIDDDDRRKIYDDDDQEEGFSSQGQKYCINCGAMLKKDSNFCASCGTKI
ncbi:MAG: zinc ribbon domain-containing protein [Asgard group archaeon]|nr:zinc ribbon domain-containing protein [Asgard group archaeon]